MKRDIFGLPDDLKKKLIASLTDVAREAAFDFEWSCSDEEEKEQVISELCEEIINRTIIEHSKVVIKNIMESAMFLGGDDE